MTKSKRDRIFGWWISRLLFFNFLISVMISILLVNFDWFNEHYNFSYDYLSELFNTSLATSVFYLLVTYRFKLCLYNKVAAWGSFSTFVFNVIALTFFTVEDHQFYSELYVNFMLYPTAILAVNYMIIEERKPKPKP